MLASRSPDYDELDSYLKQYTERRPLYAPYWRNRARGAFEAGHLNSALQYADKAVSLWPNRPLLAWKVALLYSRFGYTDRALDALRSVVENEPNSAYRALTIALRLVPDPNIAIMRILPGDDFHIDGRDDIVWHLLRIVRDQKQIELGSAIWKQFSDKAKSNRIFVLYYVEWMASKGMREEAVNAWREFRGLWKSDTIVDPGFEEAGLGGLAWRIHKQDGVTAERSKSRPHSGNQSLHVKFSGTENVDYQNVRQFIPVEPGAKYKLGFYWAGDNITTRSGPYVAVREIPGGNIARTERKWGLWSWEEIVLEFQVAEGAEIVELYIARSPTDALDNKIRGDLWLDDFTLVRDPHEE